MSLKESADGEQDVVASFIIKHKDILIILGIIVLGILLRYVAVLHVEPNADEMVHGPHAKGIVAAGVIGRIWQSITWSYLTDLAYSLLGVTMLAARSLSFVFGVLSILLVYVLAKELFTERAARLAAFILALSSYHIVYTLIEMDLAAVFFVLSGALFFLRKLRKDGTLSSLAAVCIGVAALIKTLALFFVPAFIMYYFIHHKKITLAGIKQVIVFCLIILVVFSPIFIHNYLWYKDKQLVDAYLSQYFDVGNSREAYAGIQGISHGFKFGELVTGSRDMLFSLFKLDPLTLVLGIFGLALFALRRQKETWFFILFQVFAFILITATNRLQTHYAVLPAVFALYAGAFVDSLADTHATRIQPKKFIIGFVCILVIVNVFVMLPYLGSGTAVTKMRAYAQEHIAEKDIVVADGRIYRGRIIWMFIDKHYVESTLLPEIIAANNNVSGVADPYTVWFVECVPDDCGWGTIKDQPQFNASTEALFASIKKQAPEVASITGGGSPLVAANQPYFKVYKGMLNVKPRIVQAIDETHSFFYYPANYKPAEKVFDSYAVNGVFDKLLYLAAKTIIWLSILFALACIVWIIVVFWQAVRKV